MNQPEDDPETERVRELLARTVRFLTHCSQDPKKALEAEDPRDLIRGLEALAAGPAPANAQDNQAPQKTPEKKDETKKRPEPHKVDESAPPSIDIRRRRRSA